MNRRSGGKHAAKKPLTAWVIEFSKKVVILCVVIHVAAFVYSAVVMWRFMDISALPTIISESSEVLRSCVFGYMIKAGLENWQKIRNAAAGNSAAVQSGTENTEMEEPKG